MKLSGNRFCLSVLLKVNRAVRRTFGNPPTRFAKGKGGQDKKKTTFVAFSV